eukprot:910013-Pyramimonas_sp.AAC.1
MPARREAARSISTGHPSLQEVATMGPIEQLPQRWFSKAMGSGGASPSRFCATCRCGVAPVLSLWRA